MRAVYHRSRDMNISELANLLQSKLTDIQQRTQEDVMSMATVLRLKMGSFISDITANISELRGESAKASKALEAAIENIANITRKSLDRLHRQHNLVVTGVPYLSEEKLGTYFHDWCRALGYSHEGYTPVVSAQRISKRRISVNRSSAIILRFAIRSQRFFLPLFTNLQFVVEKHWIFEQ